MSRVGRTSATIGGIGGTTLDLSAALAADRLGHPVLAVVLVVVPVVVLVIGILVHLAMSVHRGHSEVRNTRKAIDTLAACAATGQDPGPAGQLLADVIRTERDERDRK